MKNKDKIEEIAESVKEQHVKELYKSLQNKLVAKVAKSAQGKLIAHVSKLTEEVRDLVESNDEGFEKVVDYLQKQQQRSRELSKGSERLYKEVSRSLLKLAQSNQRVEVTNLKEGMTADQIKDAFKDVVLQLNVLSKNLMVSQDQIPESASVRYNNQNKVSQITEKYKDSTIITKISYNRDGQVVGWNSVKS